MILTNNLSVGYGKKIILSNINIEVKPGQIMTLIGPNGSGKSTVLKTIIGQLGKLGGTISVCIDSAKGEYADTDDMNEAQIAGMISIVMTERIKSELMTCRDVVETGRYPYTGRLGILSKEDHVKVDEALAMVNATNIADSAFDSISDGQRQRIMLARAICQDTDIIILDEPTSYLDMKYKLELLKLIRYLAHEKGKTIIMSLHELDLARAVSDTIVCVDGNEVTKSGTVDEIYTGNYLQQLFGVDEDEFDPLTGHMRLKDEVSS